MSDQIERKAAKEAYCKKFCHPGVMCPDSGFCREVDEAFDSVPSAQPERKKGKWVLTMEGNSFRHQCNQCNTLYPNANGYNFCPNCGADMRGKQDESD